MAATLLSHVAIRLMMVFILSAFSVESTRDGVADFFPDEREALIKLRDSLNSSFDLHSNWTGPVCHENQSRWVGVSCSGSHVTHVVLEGIQLTGSLPDEFLQNLTFLSKLSFRNNSISGPLPNLTDLLRLQVVFLSRNHFSGAIPSAYAELPRLERLELQENHLQGEIPPFDQTTLVDFNVSHNQLQGPIPETPTLLRFPEESFDYNAGLCGRPVNVPCPVSPSPQPNSPPSPSPEPPRGRQRTGLTVWTIASIAAAGALVLLSFLAMILCFYRRGTGKSGGACEDFTDKKSRWSESTEDAENNGGLVFLDGSRQIFDLDDLLRSSAEILGRGSLGTTYKAVLESGPVAVKRLKQIEASSRKEFNQQMEILGKLKHQNLAEIISYYYSSEEKLIIYEYIQEGSLFELLHENRGIGRMPLNWTARLSIIRDICRGLSFLHQSLPPNKMPHGNLKSTNILVHHSDQDSCHSKLTDYGLLPLLSSQESIKKLAIGRVPEFSLGKKLTITPKADVYCFGIVLLEIITGRVPGETHRRDGGPDDGGGLPGWVKRVVSDDWSTDILDMELLVDKEGHDEMLKLTEIALECTDDVPQHRPEISDILIRIENIELRHRANIGETS